MRCTDFWLPQFALGLKLFGMSVPLLVVRIGGATIWVWQSLQVTASRSIHHLHLRPKERKSCMMAIVQFSIGPELNYFAWPMLVLCCGVVAAVSAVMRGNPN